MKRALFSALALLIVVVAGCSGSDQRPSSAAGPAGPRTTSATANTTVAGAASAGATSGGATRPAGPAAPAPGTPDRPAGQGLPVPGVAARIVKTGGISLEVSPTEFSATAGRVTTLAVGSGGYVAASDTHETGDRPNGTITLRVPVSAFEDVVNQVRTLGRVVASTVSTQDVTGEYADVEARLRALTATRERYFILLANAVTIPDILTVQDRIDAVQLQIEQLQGQLKVLDDQTTYSTLAVSISEVGQSQERVVAATTEPPTGFRLAWDRAVHGFTKGIEGVVSASGVLLFIALCAAVLALPVRALWRRTRPRPQRAA